MSPTDYTDGTDGGTGRLRFAEDTKRIIGACFSVYNAMGCGFLEPVYHDCLAIELRHMKIPFVHEPSLPLIYRGEQIGHTYSPDFICFDRIIVELKAVSHVADEHRAQIINYLNAAQLHVGLLINFGHHPGLQYERFVL